MKKIDHQFAKDLEIYPHVSQKWFCNYDTKEQAQDVADKLNDQAESGNGFMNCSFYTYNVGPAMHTEDIMFGLWGWWGKCQHCGKSFDDHQFFKSSGSHHDYRRTCEKR